MRILISGAGIAGLACARLAASSGHEVTLLERAHELRAGGQAVDVRGPALAVMSELGLLEEAVARSTAVERTVMVDRTGRVRATLSEAAYGNGPDDLEIGRGDLARLLLVGTERRIDLRWGTTLVAIDERHDRVEVQLSDGGRATCDLVVGADGMRSATARLGLGQGDETIRRLGGWAATFAMDTVIDVRGEQRTLSLPGATAMVATTAGGDSRGLLVVRADGDLPGEEGRRREAVAQRLAGRDEWVLPELVAQLRGSQDCYVDDVAQRRAPRWVTGRVALLGDAAWAPSLLSGQGTPLALAGARVLVGELARADVPRALAVYEERLRPPVERIQRIGEQIAASLFPSRAALWVNEHVLFGVPRLLEVVTRLGVRQLARAGERIDLSDYPQIAA